METNSNQSLDDLAILSSGEILRRGKFLITNGELKLSEKLEKLDKILSSDYLDVKDRKNLTDANIVYLTNAKMYDEAVKFALGNQYTTKEVWNMIGKIKMNQNVQFEEPDTDLGIYYG